jgi:hypothetical protein
MAHLTLFPTRSIHSRVPLAAGLVALLAIACSDQPAAPNAVAGDATDLQSVGLDGQMVTGSGHLTLEGSARKFAVSARKAADGTASGQAQIIAGNADNTIHIAIDCVVISGNTAVLSGVTTREALFPPGEAVFFAVQDNGQGAGSPADRVSLAFIGGAPLPNLCELVGFPPASFLLPVEQGDISVRE